MNVSEGFRSSIVTARRLLLVVSAVSLATACGGNNTPNATAGLPPSPTSVQGVGPTPSAIQINVSPALSPNFDPSIHDYVVNCASNPEVQFTAQGQNANIALLYGNGGLINRPQPYPATYLQRTFPLTPGQRFHFVTGADASEYSVRCLPSDFPPLTVSVAGNAMPQAEWYLFAPDLADNAPGYSAYVILADAHGTPVWWTQDPGGTVVDAKILSPTQIAWTLLTSYGAGGQYVIRDFDGHTLNTIIGDIDDHELVVTPAGTYLVIEDAKRACPPDCADMSPWGGNAQAGVIEAEIVELDRNSNVLWKWRTRDHIALSETGATGWFATAGDDIIHMNAIEPDGTDGLFFSARHLNAIYHVTKSTGVIDWKIGGTPRPESLVVLGDSRPTSIGASGQSLSGPHDVRKLSDGTISVHDNGSIANRPPFAIRYRIDTAARTAEVVEAIQDTRVSASAFTGSARRLPGGHWLVQWGGAPFMTELDAAGNPVLTIQYNLGSGFSYRAVPVLSGTLSAVTLRDGMDAIVGN
jgi:hypothetical protein